MALINLDLLANETTTIDSSNSSSGDVINLNVLGGGANLIVDGVDVDINTVVNGAVLGNTTISVVNGADATITGLAGVSAGSSVTYSIGENASLAYGGGLLNVGLLNSMTIDMSAANGTGTLNYTAPALNLDLSSFPTITGLSNGDTLNIAQAGLLGGSTQATSVTFSNGVLTAFNGILPIAMYTIEGYPEGATFDLANGVITYACFLRGTMIATPEGEVAVETLKAGDKVSTASGGVATVKWLGYRKLHTNRISAANAIRAYPVQIKQGALGENLPTRDLTVSPGHHLYFDGALVPAMLLVNGKTIVQQFDARSFEYFHVELEKFDILLADGVPAESYVDTGNRSMFQNADTVAMNPDFGPAEGRPQVDGITVERSGPVVEALRRRLMQRAEAITNARRVTDAQLHIEVNGQIVRSQPEFVREGVYRFELPAGASAIRVLSRSAVVRDMTPHARRDLRQVGVGLSAIVVADANGRREIDLNDMRLEGLNLPQDVHGTAMRWTIGEAVIPAELVQASGKATLELTVLRTYTYWVDADTQAPRARRAA